MPGERRKEAAQRRKAEKIQQATLYPRARLDDCREDYGVVVSFEPGEENYMRVSVRGKLPLSSYQPQWSMTRIRLDDNPCNTLQFIRAARYNAMVREANDIAVQISIMKMQPAPSSASTET